MTPFELVRFIKTSPQHRYVYHFTDEENFPSIAEKGLVSKETMRAENWWPQHTGGNQLSHQLDTRRGIDPFVSLCFTRKHGMKFLAQSDGRLPNPRYLKISPEVLLLPNTRVAFGIANANETEILPIEQAIPNIDLEVIYTKTNWSDPAINSRLRKAEKMEILIQDRVGVELIKGYF